MKITKLLENISKGKVEKNTKIKIDNEIEIIYKLDDDNDCHYFEDTEGNKVDIMKYFSSDFILELENRRPDIWDEVYRALNANKNKNSNIEKGIGTSNEPSEKCPKFTISSSKNKIKLSDGPTDNIHLFYDDLEDYTFDDDHIAGFYNTAEGYFDAALVMINNYSKRFEKVFDLGNSNTNIYSFGYNQDSIIRTLLAFSCECYLKSLLLKQGKSLNDIKKLSHGLVDLYHALDSDTFSDVFLDMEQNGYQVLPYLSPKIPFDSPDLTEKFMLELGIVDDAFIESRYCAEKDKNTNYGFLYKFAKALKNITREKIQSDSLFSNNPSIKR